MSHYKVTLYCLSFITFALFGCNPNSKHLPASTNEVSPLSLPLNPKQGYSLNVITNDSIKQEAIDISTKKTIVTGKPLHFKGKRLLRQPPAQNMKYAVSVLEKGDNIKRVKSKKPKIVSQKKDSTDPKKRKYRKPLKNSLGESIVSATPVPLIAHKRLLRQPPPTTSSYPQFKDKGGLNIQSFGISQGMLSPKIYDIHIGKDGIIWLATYNGITRYNRQTFIHYTKKDGLPNGNIRAIMEDSNGNIWFSSRNTGLCKYDGDSLSVFTIKGGLSDDEIWPIVEDKRGNIWWGSGKGLGKYDGKQVTHYTTKEGLSDNLVETVLEDRQGNIWVGTTDGGVHKFDHHRFTQYQQYYDLPTQSVYAMFEDKQGNIWLGYQGAGLVKYDGRQFIQYTKEQGLPSNYINTISEDRQGNIWLGTPDTGLIQFDGISFTSYTRKDNLPDNDILKIVCDKYGNLWAGTFEGGFIKGNFNTFVHTTQKEGLFENIVRGIDTDSNGNLWMGVLGKGLVKFDGTSYALYNSTFFTNYTIYSVKCDRKNNVWVGTDRGLLKYINGKLMHYLPQFTITSVLEDRMGNIWVGSLGHGVFKFSAQGLTQYTQKDGLLSNNVWALLQDKQDNIWVASNQGVSKFKDTTVIHFSQKEGLSDHTIRSLFEDSQGNIWFGTYNQGVMCFDGKNITYYTTKQGLPSNHVESIIEDYSRNIWIGTEAGLVCLSKTKTDKLSLVNYGVNDGLKALNFKLNSVFLSRDNVLWWGVGKSLIKMNINKKNRINPELYNLKMNQLYINEHFLDYRQLNDSIKQIVQFDSVASFGNYPINLSVPYYLNQFSFSFEVVNRNSLGKVRYSHRIKELSQRWSVLSTNGLINYHNLPYGKFTLQVKVVNEGQQWGETYEYQFTIRPPWWQIWWLKLLISTIIITLLIIVYNWRMANFKRNQNMLEDKVQQKTLALRAVNQQLRKLNDDLEKTKNKERRILETAMKNGQQHLLVLTRVVTQKLNKIKEIDEKLGEAIQSKKRTQLVAVKAELSQFIKDSSDVGVLAKRFESKYPKVLANIKNMFPNLSANDIKHCLLLSLDFSSKEAAQLLGVSHHAVIMARKRLKKKIDVPQDLTLRQFIKKVVAE